MVDMFDVLFVVCCLLFDDRCVFVGYCCSLSVLFHVVRCTLSSCGVCGVLLLLVLYVVCCCWVLLVGVVAACCCCWMLLNVLVACCCCLLLLIAVAVAVTVLLFAS